MSQFIYLILFLYILSIAFVCTFVFVYFVCDIQSSPTDIFHLNESFRLHLFCLVLFHNFLDRFGFFTLYNTMNDINNCIVLIETFKGSFFAFFVAVC